MILQPFAAIVKHEFTNVYSNFKLAEQAVIHSKKLSLEVTRIDLLRETTLQVK